MSVFYICWDDGMVSPGGFMKLRRNVAAAAVGRPEDSIFQPEEQDRQCGAPVAADICLTNCKICDDHTFQFAS